MLPRSAHRLVLPAAALAYALMCWLAVAPRLGDPFVQWALKGTSWTDGSSSRALDDTFSALVPYQQDAINLAGTLRMSLFREAHSLEAIVGSGGWLFHRADMAVLGGADERLDLAMTRIAEAHRTLQARGIDLLVLPLPAKADIERAHHSEPAVAAANEQLYRDFRRALAELGIESVDVRDAFLAARAEGEVLYRSDQHWTPHGARVAAEFTADHVRRRWPELVDRKALELRPRSIEMFQGDLASFVGDRRASGAAGIVDELVLPHRAIPVGEEWPEPPQQMRDIMLVGTSASADIRWSFFDFLQHALQSGVSNQSRNGNGPIQPMEEAFAAMETADFSPRLLIWEFPVNALFRPGEIEAPMPTVEAVLSSHG